MGIWINPKNYDRASWIPENSTSMFNDPDRLCSIYWTDHKCHFSAVAFDYNSNLLAWLNLFSGMVDISG